MSASVPSAVNYWPDSACARAFWGQHELPPYRWLLADTAAWLDPQPGQRWLDLGCGCGQLTQAIWLKSVGTVGEVVGLDCAAANGRAFDKFCATIQPAPAGRIRFIQADFSTGLSDCPDAYFDGVVSGMAIQYAESYSAEQGCWTTAAYDRLLEEVHRVLRPHGCFIFSVNVPEPSWGRVGLHALSSAVHVRQPGRYLKNIWRMWRYGVWLKRQARRGRFHYLPLERVVEKLAATGFADVEHRLSYAGQAYLLRCRKLSAGS
jgi:ubiquinone/menaquinone biosynthesis C-methylase UbiE